MSADLGSARSVGAGNAAGRGRPLTDSRFAHVFTATFNRAHVLHRVYDSLRAQTFRDFEWLMVDRGTSDTVSPWLQ